MAAQCIHSGLLSTGIGDKSHAAISPIWQLLLSSIGLELLANTSFPYEILGMRTPVDRCCKGWGGGIILCAVDKPPAGQPVKGVHERRSRCIGGAGAMGESGLYDRNNRSRPLNFTNVSLLDEKPNPANESGRRD